MLGFLLLIPGTRESKLLQTIGSHVSDQLHSPLRPICSPRLYRGNPFQLFFTYLTFKNYPEKVDRWLENLIDRNEIQRTTLNATFDPFAGIPTTKNMASCTSFQWFRILSTMRVQNIKYKIWSLNFQNGPNSSWILI